MSDSKRQSDGNLAAKRLGELLLKGYRMLDASCPHCNTVLMQAKDGHNICVLCENSRKTSQIQSDVTETEAVKHNTNIAEMDFEPVGKQNLSCVQRAIDVVLDELGHSANQLELQRNSATLQARQELVSHIHHCADTIHILKTLQT